MKAWTSAAAARGEEAVIEVVGEADLCEQLGGRLGKAHELVVGVGISDEVARRRQLHQPEDTFLAGQNRHGVEQYRRPAVDL